MSREGNIYNTYINMKKLLKNKKYVVQIKPLQNRSQILTEICDGKGIRHNL